MRFLYLDGMSSAKVVGYGTGEVGDRQKRSRLDESATSRYYVSNVLSPSRYSP
ncbi:hypothetical protein GCM10011579_063630 [Streptomyces albiflavescens]|uniref:Uncharacterized protein n=1 Tax=Streptomyces albiflavescens TaxID=1623582 RepID=A0A917Y8W0_9ACTN|nr:hypothetical protein [Streptomyces albiflavescens]GGN79329.1 hypothetical protein GCM10011579_063630 [Streptomyces albiflavescens]